MVVWRLWRLTRAQNSVVYSQTSESLKIIAMVLGYKINQFIKYYNGPVKSSDSRVELAGVPII